MITNQPGIELVGVRLDHPRGGAPLVDEASLRVTGGESLLLRRVGIVPQDLCLLEDRSAQLNVVLPLEIDGIPRSVSTVRAAHLLALLGLGAEAVLPVDGLSLAARKRVAVARALV